MIDRLRPAARSVAVALTIALVGACASSGTVVLLPETDGKPTAVTVRQADKEVVLDRPYAAAKVASQGLDAYQSSPQEVEAQFGRALAAQPIRAETFILYFVEGKDEFTDESKRLVDKILAEVARRPVPDVLVVGHTDTVGTDQLNDALGAATRRNRSRGIDRAGRSRRRRAGDLARQARAGRADGRRRRGAAQPPGRNHRPLSGARDRRQLTAARGPFQRSARTVRSSAGSAPAANDRTSAQTASTTPCAVTPGRESRASSASRRGLP